MEETPGDKTPRKLSQQLAKEGTRLPFYHAVLSLERLFPEAAEIGSVGPIAEEPVRLRPSLSLSCPPADLESIRFTDHRRAQVTTTFLGLYGSDSPLPYYFSERLFQNAEEPSGQRVRDFIDIFHHRLLSLLYRTWKRGRLAIDRKLLESPLASRLLAIFGELPTHGAFKNTDLRVPEARLSMFPARTTLHLQALIEHRLGFSCIIEELLPRQVPIPQDQRMLLGQNNCILGQDSVLGSQLVDRNRIRIRFQAQTFDEYSSFLPKGSRRLELERLLEGYLIDPIDYVINVSLPAGQIPHWQIGRERLGISAWLGVQKKATVCQWPGHYKSLTLTTDDAVNIYQSTFGSEHVPTRTFSSDKNPQPL